MPACMYKDLVDNAHSGYTKGCTQDILSCPGVAHGRLSWMLIIDQLHVTALLDCHNDCKATSPAAHYLCELHYHTQNPPLQHQGGEAKMHHNHRVRQTKLTTVG